MEKCNNLGWQIQPALIHLHFQCFHLAPSLLKMKQVIHLNHWKETHENACHTTKQPGPFGYTRPLLLSEIILGTQQFSPLSICRGFFNQDESGRSLLRLWQTVSNSVSLHINRMIFFVYVMSNFHDCRISLPVLEINTKTYIWCWRALWYFLSAVVWYLKRKVPPAKKTPKHILVYIASGVGSALAASNHI